MGFSSRGADDSGVLCRVSAAAKMTLGHAAVMAPERNNLHLSFRDWCIWVQLVLRDWPDL